MQSIIGQNRNGKYDNFVLEAVETPFFIEILSTALSFLRLEIVSWQSDLIKIVFNFSVFGIVLLY